MPLDPWQRWLVIHAGEVNAFGIPRWKRLLIIVARQNGKTTLLRILTLFWMYVDRWPMLVGLSTTAAMAREQWKNCFEYAEHHPLLSEEWRKPKLDNNDPHWRLSNGSLYRPAASTRKGARGLPVDRLITDELREHHDWTAYKASVPTMNARSRAQGWFISNQGDDQSVVLNTLRATGVANIEALEAGGQEEDEELALFEWSAQPGASMTDPVALCAANPNANMPDGTGGVRVSLKSLIAQARGFIKAGDRAAIVGFQTEILCQRVSALDGALDPAAWEDGTQPAPLAEHRSRMALVPEISPDQMSASISIAAVMPDGKVRGEVVASWNGMYAERDLRRALAGWVRKIKPRKVGWIPGGGAAAIGAELDKTKLPGVEIDAIRGDAASVCMGFSALVTAGDFVHSGQERLTKQALGSAKLWRGDTWVFSRKGEGYCDSVYGVAAAAHLARTIPAPVLDFKLHVAK
jgi:hypothetical protein